MGAGGEPFAAAAPRMCCLGGAASPHLSHAGVIGFVGVEVLVDLLCQLSIDLGAPGENKRQPEEESRVVIAALLGGTLVRPS